MEKIELTAEQQIYYDIAFSIGDTCRAIKDEELRFRVWNANIDYLEKLLEILL